MTFIAGLSTGIIGALVLLAVIKLFNVSKEGLGDTDLPGEQVPVEDKIAPFVKIHMEYMQDSQRTDKEESIARLKDKIESFKHRNRFYDGK